MKLTTLLAATTTLATLATAQLTYTLLRPAAPSANDTDAYSLIAAAMDAAIARHTALGSKASRDLIVEYKPGVPTAEASYRNIRFGALRSYMTECIALHEISHALGVGQSAGFVANCAAGNWPTANALLARFDGAGAVLTCGGGHFWPYGLNFWTEMSDEAANRHVEIINAMMVDGM